jgi:hypothetical protein
MKEKQINLKYQVSLFGNYDEIVPNSDNMKFFIDNFTDKGIIPYQIQGFSIDIDIMSKEPSQQKSIQMLSLTDSEKKWDIKFNPDRIDIVFVNENIGVIKMISKEDFLQETIEILEKISSKFKKTHKRVAFVTQYLFNLEDISNLSKSFVNSINYLDEKPILRWFNKIETRTKLAKQDEIINVISDIGSINQPIKMNNVLSLFQGIAISIDINTIFENETYRFQLENLKSIFDEMLKVEEIILTQNTQKIGQ